KAIAFTLALLLCTEIAFPASPAAAKDVQYRLDIPPGPINGALSALSQATGASFGLPGELPQFRVPALRGSMSIAEALRRLLSQSGWTAVRAGATAYRIERAPRPSRPLSAPQIAK